MLWFAHIADGAELKSCSSEEAVPGVNASRLHFLQVLLTAVDGFRSPFPPELLQYSMCPPVSFFCLHVDPQRTIKPEGNEQKSLIYSELK